MLKPIIILFTAGNEPSNYERQLAASVSVPVRFLPVGTNLTNEQCDGVFGEYVPEAYQGKPGADAAMTVYRNALQAEAVAAVVVPQSVPIIAEVVAPSYVAPALPDTPVAGE